MGKKTRFVLVCTALALTAMLIYGVTQHNEPPAAAVETASAVVQDVYNSVYAPGEVEAVNTNSYTVANAAIVAEIYVKAGDTVQVGQKLVHLQDTQLSSDALYDTANALLSGTNAAPTVLEVPDDTEDAGYDVTAEMAGTVLRVPEAIGETILPGATYLTVADLAALRVRADIPESYIGQVREGQRANITSDAVPEAISAAMVKSIAPFARRAVSFTGKQATATVTTVLNLLGQQADLRPGYTVEVKIFTDTVKDAILIPYAAVGQEGQTEFVFIVDKEGKARRRTVQTGYELSDYVQIKAGIAATDTVIVSPPEGLQDGDHVEATAT